VPPQDTHPGWLCKHFCFRGLSEDESFLVFRREAAHTKLNFAFVQGCLYRRRKPIPNWWFAGTLPFADGTFHHADDGALVVPFPVRAFRRDATRARGMDGHLHLARVSQRRDENAQRTGTRETLSYAETPLAPSRTVDSRVTAISKPVPSLSHSSYTRWP
jgi:hypothetical protein